MKKGQVYEGVVTQVDFPNKGIVQVGEETVIVKNSLPGQKVKLSVNKVRKGKAEARLLEVIERSPLETGHLCSHFGVCGGCTYLSLPYEEQLKIKGEQVKRLLESVLEKDSYVWEGIKASPVAYEYRNKMEFSFGDEYKDGPLTLGMHKRGSFYDVVSVKDCLIVDSDYRRILKTVREYFADKQVSFFHRLTHTGYLRHLLVRKAGGTGEILAALVTTSQEPGASRGETPEGLIQGFRDSLLSLEEMGCLKGHFAGILHIINDSQADVVRSDHTEILYGKDFFYEKLLNLDFKVSVFSFFQTNTHSAAVLYETVRAYAGELQGRKDGKPEVQGAGTEDWEGKAGPVIFDLYTGTGTIAQLMAPVAEKVIGVEIVEEAVEAARRSAVENGLDNCEFIAGDVLKILDTITEKPDLIILDPPRDGIHPKALPKIIDYGVDHIVYISCKPTSLVRDLETFLGRGYRVEKAVAVDQFPWTANVETVVLLSRRKADDYVEVELELDELDVTSAESKATYKEI